MEAAVACVRAVTAVSFTEEAVAVAEWERLLDPAAVEEFFKETKLVYPANSQVSPIQFLNQAFFYLSQQDIELLILIYGLDGKGKHTQVAISAHFRFANSNVTTKRRRAVHRLNLNQRKWQHPSEWVKYPARSIRTLSLSLKAEACLLRHGVVTVEQLVRLSVAEIEQMPNLGPIGAQEMRRKLQTIGLDLRA